MKTITLLLATLSLLLLAMQCEKFDTTVLPPETQEGKNTFGCYVNGELFVRAQLAYGGGPVNATYERNRLEIYCRAAAEEFHSINLSIDNPREGEYNVLSKGYFAPDFNYAAAAGCLGYACENCGQIYITKFDTINSIVSGRFEFSGRCAHNNSVTIPIKYTGDSIVHITDGRFDIKLMMSNESY